MAVWRTASNSSRAFSALSAWHSRLASGWRFRSPTPLMSWLVEHTAELLTKYTISHDGRTPLERLTGNKYRIANFEFGEQVMVRTPLVVARALPPGGASEPAGGRRRIASMDARWAPGTWLGQRWGTNAHLVAVSPTEVLESRSVIRRPASERWCPEALRAICATPWRWRVLDGDPETQVEDISPPTGNAVEDQQAATTPDALEPSTPDPAEPTMRIRRMQITAALCAEYGYTPGCRQCDLMRTNRNSNGALHTEECRARFEVVLRQAQDPRILRADDRINSRLADGLQAQEEEERQGAGVAPEAAGPTEDTEGAGP